MNFSPEQINEIVVDEEARWRRTYAAIRAEEERARRDMIRDRSVARQLTAELVGARRAEDKAQLASDEAVAHGLSKLRRTITEDIGSLAKQPYFARVVTDEGGREVEFCLSTVSFPKHRIIDWRKAPISQLYYNYKQGEEFDEVIQGGERTGTIKLRRGYKGHQGELLSIELPEGVIQKIDGAWHFEETETALSRPSSGHGHLPPILSLITPDQFRLITHSKTKPIIIQGIAGSGKTTVALHRLAWLLHKDNSDARPEKSMVIVFNRSLKTYIETTLPELGIEGVAIRTYGQWLGCLAGELGGGRPYDTFASTREAEKFKSSAICLDEINKYVVECPRAAGSSHKDDLFKFYEYVSKKELYWPKWNTISAQLRDQASTCSRDQQDDSVLLNLIFAREGHYPCKSGKALGLCDHIVIDEAQDFGVVEVRALLNALDVDKTVTIVGDLAQKIVMNRHFGSWEELLRNAGFEDTSPIELNVSHRTTEEIMSCALHLRQDIDLSKSPVSTVRHGPAPVIIRSESYETQPYQIAKWMRECIEEDPHSLSAIICRSPKQASHLTETLKKMGLSFVRWGHRDNFDFSPGVTITNVNQVKGLEFRNVLIVNPSEAQYHSASEEERNLLYVAVTRAEVRLDFISHDKPTAMLKT